ncbi:hypothetical protein sos41_34170 [Alphaproteobacteria bacterium SO-S41]|nr:hypothetical protein sos41_34170 [Alphaproteobacteria bacterium SO-S41]
MLGWIWRGVLAFDRIGSRIPQLIQMMIVELIIVFCLGAFIAKAIDARGGWGCPGEGELDSTFWGALGVGLFFLFFFVRNVFWPRLVQGSWTPVTTLPMGDVGLVVANRRWTVSYEYLTSHPSYILLLLPVLWLPLLMIWATEGQGCSLFYNRLFGWAMLGVAGALALSRLVAWYVLRRGRRQFDTVRNNTVSAARAGWEIAWKPILMLMVMIHVIVFAPIGIMFWNEHRAMAALPLATAADQSVRGEYRRIAGKVKGELVLWPHEGLGRGSNNYHGGGILMDMDDGGEALLLAGHSALPGLRAAIAGAKDGHIEMVGRLEGDAITGDLADYSHMTENDFPPAPRGGRVIVEVGQYP